MRQSVDNRFSLNCKSLELLLLAFLLTRLCMDSDSIRTAQTGSEASGIPSGASDNPVGNSAGQSVEQDSVETNLSGRGASQVRSTMLRICYSRWIAKGAGMVHTSYCLQAMIIHIGVSMHAGHYRSVLVTGDRRWYYTNDNAEAVLVHRDIDCQEIGQNAYVAFYILCSQVIRGPT